MGLLDGKIAIVTGSDSGIGQATAKAFAREGADVMVCYLHDQKGAEETLREVQGNGGRAAVATPYRRVYRKETPGADRSGVPGSVSKRFSIVPLNQVPR